MKIRTDVIHIYRKLHTWTGIICGLMLFISFYAGALTVFKEPITHWSNNANYEEQDKVPLDAIPALISDIVEKDEYAATEITLNLYPENDYTHQLIWSVKDEQSDEDDNSKAQFFTAGYDQNKAVIIHELNSARMAEFLDILHRVVGLPFDTHINRWIMGVIVAIYCLALLSGLIILLPVLVKNLFAFRTESKPKRVWLDAHNVIGVFSLPLHLVMGLTAFVFAYHDVLFGVQNVTIHDGGLRQALMYGMPKPDPKQSTDPKLMLSPSKLVETAANLSPNFEPYMLQYVSLNTPRAMVRVWGRDEHAIAPRSWGGFVPMNPYTGEVQSTEYLQDRQSTSSTITSSFFALHMATYGGNVVRWLYFVLGLAGAWLFFSGNLLWLENRRQRKTLKQASPQQRKDVTVIAIITVGVTFGCMNGISLMLAASKWSAITGIESYGLNQLTYYCVFFTCIAWAIFRGPARALAELCWLVVLTTLSIPFTSLIVSFIFNSSVSINNLTAVDLIATLLSIGFILIARNTSKRVYRHDNKDSVWAYVGQ